MPEESLESAALPSGALAAERGKALRSFRPADRLGDELDTIIQLPLDVKAMELDDQLHVLADRSMAIAAYLKHRVAPEQAECARDDRQNLHRAQRYARHQESAQI